MPDPEDGREEENRGEKEEEKEKGEASCEDPQGEEDDVVFVPHENAAPTPRRSSRKRKSVNSEDVVEEKKETPARKIRKARNMASTMRSPCLLYTFDAADE